MNIEIKKKLDSNPKYLELLRMNSYWYKILNRDPNMFNNFVEELKTNYKLRTTDKINKALSTFEMVSSIISSFNS